jgi:hypothetical protein
MANVALDFSLNNLFKNQTGVKTYKYKDIGTSNFMLIHDDYHNTTRFSDRDTSNVDMAAIKASLTNLFSFRLGQEILEPLYRK